MNLGHATKSAVRLLGKALDGRPLFWFGIRGSDAIALKDLPELSGVISITSRPDLPTADLSADLCLESISGRRRDLDAYDIDLDRSESADEFRLRAAELLAGPVVVLGYRSSALVSSICGRSGIDALSADPPLLLQRRLESKKWVESTLKGLGVRCVEWSYVGDDRKDVVKQAVGASGLQVLRANRTSGGVGIEVVSKESDVDRLWPEQSDGEIAVAPFIEGLPVNFGGCVFRDGSIRLHPLSIQLLGLGGITSRTLGFCGSDFARASEAFDPSVLREVDEMGRSVGRWLGGIGYTGAFGVDAIVSDEAVHFAELNPRLQGSSLLSAAIAREAGAPDIYLDHLAASLGLSPLGPDVRIGDWARERPQLSRVSVHNVGDRSLVWSDEARAIMNTTGLAGGEAAMVPANGTEVDQGAVLFAVDVKASVTTDGFALRPEYASIGLGKKDAPESARVSLQAEFRNQFVENRHADRQPQSALPEKRGLGGPVDVRRDLVDPGERTKYPRPRFEL